MSCILLTKAFLSLAKSSGSRSIVDPTCSASFWSVSQDGPSDDWESVSPLNPESLGSAVLAFGWTVKSRTSSGGIFVIKGLEFSSFPWKSVEVSSSSIRGLLGLFGVLLSRANLSLISSMTGLEGELWSWFIIERSSSSNSWMRGFPLDSKLSSSSSMRGFLWHGSELKRKTQELESKFHCCFPFFNKANALGTLKSEAGAYLRFPNKKRLGWSTPS